MRKLFTIAGGILLISVAMIGVGAQPQALDGQIEGFVVDQNGATIPRAVIRAINTDTGLERALISEENGFYRMPLLPLGTYRLVVEAPNYMRTVREGLTLMAGHIMTIDVTLKPGEIVDTVTVTADSPITDAGRTDIGEVMTARETASLPLVTRNPLNYVLLQPNVNGRPNRGIIQFPMISANGYLRRVNYHLDGSNITQSDRAGVRIMFVPEVFVKEVLFLSNGFAPEFGNTPGVIMNMVTPSGTNRVDGSLAYLFREPPFYSRPFGYSAAKMPDSHFRSGAFRAGLPLIKNRWHLFTAYEQFLKDDNTIPNRLITITEANKAALIAAGLPASIFPASVASLDRGWFMLFRTDLQLSESHRLAVRFTNGDVSIANNTQGGINTLERSLAVTSRDRAVAVQLASYSRRLINEFRFQLLRRLNPAAERHEFSGTGPSITISNVANFGSPEGIGSMTREQPTQLQNNVTFMRGSHIAKFGGGVSHIRNFIRAQVFARYTFQTIAAYVEARNGAPRTYRRYEESSGDPDTRFSATYWNAFAQDDWKVSQRLKLSFGLRYDLYRVPPARQDSAIDISRHFKIDSDNFAPRLAAVYLLRKGPRPTVLRVGAGMYYETPWLDMYERALRKNGNPRYLNFSVTPQSPGSPAFPTVFAPGLQLGAQDIDAVAPDLEDLYAIHSNIQLEQAINEHTSISVAYIHSGGRHISVYRSVNYVPIDFLADGRPVYNPLVNAATRIDPRFNNISLAKSSGTSRYVALNVQFNTRSLRGVLINAYYTFSTAVDDAPEQNLATGGNLILSNPYDAGYDRGRSLSDQRHTLAVTAIARPVFERGSRAIRHLLNNNQFAVIATANSGQAFNIVSTLNLNNDAVLQDRPVGVGRNSGTTPPLFNLDLRYSRFVPLSDRLRLEVFAEFTNLFNNSSIVQFNNVSVDTTVTGELIGPLPDFRARDQSVYQESRQTQFGIKLHF